MHDRLVFDEPTPYSRAFIPFEREPETNAFYNNYTSGNEEDQISDSSSTDPLNYIGGLGLGLGGIAALALAGKFGTKALSGLLFSKAKKIPHPFHPRVPPTWKIVPVHPKSS